MHIETYLRPALGSNIFNGNDLDNAGRAPLVKACTSGTWNAAGPLERSRADASLPQYSHRIGLAPVRDGVWGRVSAGPTNRPCLLHGREQLGNQEKGVTVHGEMHKESMVYWHPCPREAGQRNRNRRLTNSRVPRSRREGCRRCEYIFDRASACVCARTGQVAGRLPRDHCPLAGQEAGSGGGGTPQDRLEGRRCDSQLAAPPATRDPSLPVINLEMNETDSGDW